MAEITTHVLFAKDIMNKINCNDTIKYFSFGPDVFFFSKKTRELGYFMHRKNSLLFFKNYISYIIDNNLKDNEEVLGSLYGFLTHYVLDYMVHPYIFHFDHLNRDNHRMYEMCLTKYILNEHNYLPNKYKLSYDIKCNKNEEIVKLLNHVFKETFNYYNYGNEYYKLINKAKKIYRLFRYDRFGIKKFIYKFIELFYKRKISLISFYNIKEVNMNLNHNVWNHPCNRNEKYNDSLIDLYNKSIDIVLDNIKKINLVLDGKKDIDYLDKIINNYSYVTGKDCNERLTFKYFNND